MNVGEADVERYQRDGVVVLRAMAGETALAALRAGVERNLAAPGPWASQYTPNGAPGGFFGDYCNWPDIDEYREYARNGGVGEVAAQLMRSRTARFFHEHVLVKEPGTNEVTPWHHDLPYYCVEGNQNVSLWLALDPVSAESGVQFIAGSHRWGRRFVPRKFVDGSGYGEGDGYEPPFDPAKEPEHRIVTFDLDAGDAVAFHFLTVHGAPGTAASTQRRRAFSSRWLGDDMVFALRPWLHSPPFDAHGLREGRPLDDPRFPLVFPTPSGA
jgi:ectoine hydroxylase-related dioxygenase (phytanoyl-CoA dioxygenase family)